MTLKHYYHPQSRALTSHWMLTEMQLEHEQIVIDFHAGENNSAEFLAVNPMAKIPALVDDDVVVTETAAICAYLADRFPEQGFAPASGSRARGKYYRYLFFPGTTLEPMFSAEMLGLESATPQSTGWGDRQRCMNAIDNMTPVAQWVLGDQFSAADVVFGGMLDFAVNLGWIAEPTQVVLDYVQRLRERPAYQLSHAAAE